MFARLKNEIFQRSKISTPPPPVKFLTRTCANMPGLRIVYMWSFTKLISVALYYHASLSFRFPIEILAIVHFYNILEFQGPYRPLKNSSPCGEHAHYTRITSRFAQKVTLEILDFSLQTDKHPRTL